MTSRTCLLAMISLCACETEVVHRAPTQVTVRIHASVETQLGATRLRLRINGINALGDRDFAQVQWPLDIPVVPAHEDNGALEIVVDALDAMNTLVANDRIRTNFVPREQKLAELSLHPCSSTRALCELADCTGAACLRCESHACVATGDTAGVSLPALLPGAVALDAVPQCPVEPRRCSGRTVETCSNGRWSTSEECAHACAEAACTGICTPGEPDRCAPDAALRPEHCNDRGQWELVANSPALCPFACQAGVCTGECSVGSKRCGAGMPAICSADARWQVGAACAQFCGAQDCATAPSCAQVAACGQNQSCCRSLPVPGGTFERSFDGGDYTDATAKATVSPFLLDAFEVTVGRFRRWVGVYDGIGAKPVAGAGKNLRNATDPGWQIVWDTQLPATAAQLLASFASCTNNTWTDQPTSDDKENLPINCVSWYLAQAFCIWDGGRLPTEAEWNFAAAGGAEQRVYPWSQPPSDPTIDESRAVFEPAALASVGSKPAGAGRWGQLDLAGNLWEWTQDFSFDPYPEENCSDCAVLTVSDLRVTRGGSYAFSERAATASVRNGASPELLDEGIGFRCARND